VNFMKADTQNRSLKVTVQSQHEVAGFTLLETAIAMVLMMIVGLGAASLFVYAMGTNSSARDRELSMAVAQQQMEFLRNAPFTDVETRVTATGGPNKQVPSAGRQYVVTTTVTGDSNQKTITVRVTPAGTDVSALTPTQQTFGVVTLVTQRATGSLGPNFRH
jgi:Tfp pilus assembly protein PilV